ncbi:hypothetical protein B0T25DRAFT_553284 [Lasiosphaeria hispida]|uniref:F-box domain-containing protein n=1 Tax=Lasiosphaeria hispida TaxID=260671 RepID=A0AAJ0HCB5_9PEZI|nr:hypothetical protein B0T25DRAFT_553284 [Lasiosphaeria hispida]
MARQLFHLPEETLLAIMMLLDPTSLQCLRRVSRIFLRLFSDPYLFRHWHYDLSALKPNYPQFPWLRASPAFESLAYDDKSFSYLIQLDEKQKQCLSCRISQAENPKMTWDLMNEYLFCTACLVDHPTALFSAPERTKKGPNERRTCIGHQGYIRLCQHEVITWEAVLLAKSQLTAEDTPDSSSSLLLRECRHPSHQPAHHGAVDDLGHYPMALLARSKRCVVLGMTWIGHLDLPSKETQFSASEMASCLLELRRGAAEYLIPQAGPGTLPEMRCFDPNNCGCLDPGDKYLPNTQWSLRPPWCPLASDAGNMDKCCRFDPSLRLIPPPGGSGGSHATMTVLGQAFGSESGWFVDVKACSAGQHCLSFRYHRTITCTGYDFPTWRTLDPSWFEALDPDSYRVWADHETKGMLWCLDPSCTNYYRYLERPISRRCRDVGGSDFYAGIRSTTAPSPFRIQGVMTNNIATIIAEQERIARELGIPSPQDVSGDVTAPTVATEKALSNAIRKLGRKLRSLFNTKEQIGKRISGTDI